MAKLSELLPENNALFSVASRGEIILIDADKRGGFKPSNTGLRQKKFVVILGEDDSGVTYGVLLVNSHDYASLGDVVRNHSYPISPVDYPFLSRPSYIYCGSILRIDKNRFSEARIKSVATVRPEDMELIITTILDSPIISINEKKRFGIRIKKT